MQRLGINAKKSCWLLTCDSPIQLPSQVVLWHVYLLTVLERLLPIRPCYIDLSFAEMVIQQKQSDISTTTFTIYTVVLNEVVSETTKR